MNKTKIPKIIHYCWFGGKPLPDLAKKCIDSWRKFCPDYEIKEWNEQNYDVRKIPYTTQSYDAKKYAFVSDYARLDIIYEHGGIYLDIDVELIKPLDNLLNLIGFIGFEEGKNCNTGAGFGAVPKLPIIKEFLDYYNKLNFVLDNGKFDTTTCTMHQTNLLLKKGLLQNNSMQELEGLTIFPDEYFCPKDLHTGELHKTKNTYSIHHFGGFWAEDGVALIKRNRLDSWGFKLLPQEESIYSNALQYKFSIKNKQELLIAANLMDRMFANGKEHYEHDNLRILIKSFLKQIAESGIKNKATSLKLYLTTFRKWKIFETPRAHLRYIYHCLKSFVS